MTNQTMTKRYAVYAVADENCDRINPDSLIGETDDHAEAEAMASNADYPWGAAIVDRETSLVDFGAGFGVEVDYPYGAEV